MKRFVLLMVNVVVICIFINTSCAIELNESTDLSSLDETSFSLSKESEETVEELSEDSSILINAKENIDLASIQNSNKAAGGYAIEVDGTLFFSNPADGNSLYKKRIGSDIQTKAGHLQSEFAFTNFQHYEDSLFYKKRERLENIIETEYFSIVFSNTVVCMDLVSNEEKEILNSHSVIDFVVYDGSIFYTTYSENKKVELLQFDLTEQSNRKLADFDYPMSMQACNNRLYLCFDEMLAIYDINSKATSFHLLPQYNFAVFDDEIIFIDSGDMRLYKLQYDYDVMDFDYEGVIQLSNEKVKSFNMYDDDLIFSDFETGNLYYVSGSTNEKHKIGSGNYPIITSKGIIYMNDNDNMEMFEFHIDNSDR